MMSKTSTVATRKDVFGPPFWGALWRSAGLQSAGLFAAAAFLYGYQPAVGSSPEVVALFYDGDRMRIFIASALAGLAIVNLMWFGAAVRTELAGLDQEGWGAAATAASSAFAATFLIFMATVAALAYSIADAARDATTTGANDFAWACLVLSSFPRAMFVMAGSFGLWRAKVISDGVFTLCVFAVILVLAGGTTWASQGAWTPDGIFSRYVSPIVCLAWLVFASGLLLTRPRARQNW